MGAGRRLPHGWRSGTDAHRKASWPESEPTAPRRDNDEVVRVEGGPDSLSVRNRSVIRAVRWSYPVDGVRVR